MRNICPIDSTEALLSVPKARSLHCCPAFTVELFILVSRVSQLTHWGALCTEGAVHSGSGKERIWDTNAGEMRGKCMGVCVPRPPLKLGFVFSNPLFSARSVLFWLGEGHWRSIFGTRQQQMCKGFVQSPSILRHWLSSDSYPGGSLVDALGFCCSNTFIRPRGRLQAFPGQLTDNSSLQPGLTWEPPIGRSCADNLDRKESSLETLAPSSASPRWKVRAESPSRGNSCLPLVSTTSSLD